MFLKKFTVIAVAIMLVSAIALTGCSSPAPSATATSSAATSAPAASSAAASSAATSAPAASSALTGSLTAVGSSALQPLAQEGATEFMAKNSGVSVQVQGGGSGTGLSQVSSKACDIGDSDLYAEDKLPADQAKALVDHKVCVVGFAAVTSTDVTVTNLTGDQLIGIFTGKITNWKDVGGKDEKIILLSRPASSGTRFTFDKYALGGASEAAGVALTEDSSGAIKTALSTNPGSISYLALPYIDSSVHALQFNGVDANADNIKSGKYTIWSYEHMYTNGEATGAVKAFLDFMVGADFAPQITKLGYIPISDMQVTR
jgi:phosphate transport system substrate-binding protein